MNKNGEIRKFSPKSGAIGAIFLILILTVLEFPAPLGFETRPQTNVSLGWLTFFLLIVITEIATIPLILKRPKLGVIFGISAAIMNILQVCADQLHLMQPEVASFGYTMLELSVAFVSIMLGYFCLQVGKSITYAKK